MNQILSKFNSQGIGSLSYRVVGQAKTLPVRLETAADRCQGQYKPYSSIRSSAEGIWHDRDPSQHAKL